MGTGVSAWGKAWGKSWGNSWGPQEKEDRPIVGSVAHVIPSKSRRASFDDDEEAMQMVANLIMMGFFG